MPGVKGAGGPPPKRESQRRRVNKPEIPVDTADSRPAEVLQADEAWHPVAKLWFESLGKSGQSVFYQSSDWATAYMIGESMSREFKPQPLVVGSGKDAAVEMYERPPTGAALSAWLKGMTVLMATEGDRRRLRLELVKRSEPADPEVAKVAQLDALRGRIAG